jgi:hypothetical protein
MICWKLFATTSELVLFHNPCTEAWRDAIDGIFIAAKHKCETLSCEIIPALMASCMSSIDLGELRAAEKPRNSDA